MGKVGIVCDSTCDLDQAYYEANDVTMVPLKVMFGQESFLDWVELLPDEFYRRLPEAAELPTTSQPSPADFTAAYERLASDGCEEIVSVHLSAPLSGTFQSATIAAETSSVPVRVVDTKVVAAATGLCLMAAVEARASGADAAAVEKAATDAASAVRIFFVLDTLEYLVKGGRAGKASGLAASLLNIKPILTFNPEGTIEPFSKVKGTAKALASLAEHVAAASKELGKLRLVVFHAVSPEMAAALTAALDLAGADYTLDSTGTVGSVIGTYAGPKAVGCAYVPA